MEELRERGIQFQALISGIDTTTAQGKFFFTIMVGLNAARSRGRKGGRSKMSHDKINHALTLYGSEKYTIKEIHEKSGVSKAKLYREIRKRKEEK